MVETQNSPQKLSESGEMNKENLPKKKSNYVSMGMQRLNPQHKAQGSSQTATSTNFDNKSQNSGRSAQGALQLSQAELDNAMNP